MGDDDLPIGPAEWPGVRCAYRFVRREDAPVLELRFAFDPAAAGAVAEALTRYEAAIAQFGDPGTAVTLGTTLLPPPGEVGDGDALRSELLGYAEAIAAELRKAVDGSGEPQGLPLVVVCAIDPSLLAQLDTDLVPAEVTLAALAVTPDIPPGDGGLEAFATDFEAVFAGFDGASGSVRLTVRSDQANSPTPPATDYLWALRQSAKAGIDVTFAGGEPAYFAPAPLSLSPLYGSAAVPSYDEDLQATYQDATFSAVDLDGWARIFLGVLDALLSPPVATALEELDAAAYEELVLARAALAKSLAAGVVPIRSSCSRTRRTPAPAPTRRG